MKIRIEIEGDRVELLVNEGWENRVVSVEELGEIMGEEELVKVKFKLMGINSEMRVK